MRTLICLTLVASSCASWGISYGTSFEAPDWVGNGTGGSFAPNSWSGNGVNVPYSIIAAPTGKQTQGFQSVRYDQTVANATTFHMSRDLGLTTSNRYIYGETWVYIDSTTQAGRAFGLEGETKGFRAALKTDGSFMGYDATTFTWKTLATGITAATDKWHKVGLEIDLDGKAAYGYINGAKYEIGSNLSIGAFDSVQRVRLMGYGFTSSKGKAYFDDYYVTNQVVPEPGLMMGLGATLLAIVRRRRSRSIVA